jgi:flagellar protein FlgJ
MNGIAPTHAATGPAADDARLRRAARQLEGVFVEQLFKAMRETVPTENGILSGGAGEEIFTSLLDQHVAGEAASQWERGLGDALYRQLRKSTAPAADTPTQRVDP